MHPDIEDVLAGRRRWALVEGDCLDVLPTLPAGAVDAVIADPPWGVDADTDYTRFVGGLSPNADWGTGILGDDAPFDPAPWLLFPIIALWGAHCFSDRLTVGRWLVWLKKRESQLGTFMSDAELCWVNRPKTPRRAPGVYALQHVWHGFDRQTERSKVLHPSQKPVRLMAWTMEMADVPADAIVLDPYCGSGTTGVACLQTGRRFIGVEISAEYAAIARKRLEAAERDQRDSLFPAAGFEAEPVVQGCLFAEDGQQQS